MTRNLTTLMLTPLVLITAFTARQMPIPHHLAYAVPMSLVFIIGMAWLRDED